MRTKDEVIRELNRAGEAWSEARKQAREKVSRRAEDVEARTFRRMTRLEDELRHILQAEQDAIEADIEAKEQAAT